MNNNVRNLKFTKKGVAIVLAFSMVGASLYYSIRSNHDDDLMNNPKPYFTDGDSSNDSEVTDDFDVYKKTHDWGMAATENDKYGKVRKLEEITGISPMTLDRLIQKYSVYTKYSYEDAIKVLEAHLSNILYDYKSREEGVICVLFDQAILDGNLSLNCPDDLVEKRYNEYPNSLVDPEEAKLMLLQQKEEEKIMLSICDDLGMDSIDITVALAIYRLETGHGSSELCVQHNNYGGNRVAGQLEFHSFSTPEFGMYYTLSHLKQFYFDRLKEQGYNDCYNIVVNMSRQYCETPEEWAVSVNGLVAEVNDEYHLLDEGRKVFN